MVKVWKIVVVLVSSCWTGAYSNRRCNSSNSSDCVGLVVMGSLLLVDAWLPRCWVNFLGVV